MMSFDKLVSTYGRDGTVETMEKLTRKIDWFVDKVMEKDPELVEKFIMKVDLLLNPHFTKSSAEYVVSEMKNKDGTTGEHWSYDQTTEVLKDEKWNFEEADWYYTLNMIYSDYYKNGRTTETYVEMAHDFLADTDAPDCKAKKYYWAMCC